MPALAHDLANALTAPGRTRKREPDDTERQWLLWIARGLLAFAAYTGWQMHVEVVKLREEVNALQKYQSEHRQSHSTMWQAIRRNSGTPLQRGIQEYRNGRLGGSSDADGCPGSG